MAETDRTRLDLDGSAAPPRANGELVFSAPWESRVFGITMALCAAGRLEWEAFRCLLIEEIAARESGTDWSYYACWQSALERLLDHEGLFAAAEIESRAQAYAKRPAGHDH